MEFFLSEFLGTFILSGSFTFMAVYTRDTQMVSLPCVLTGFIIALQFSRRISGGHLNPGVTLMFMFKSRELFRRENLLSSVLPRVLGQVVGGLIAPMLTVVLYGQAFVLKVNTNVSVSSAVVGEVLGSVVFFLVIIIQDFDKLNLTNQDEVISSLTIAAGLGGGIAIAGNLSGAGLNPALAIGFNLVRFLTDYNLDSLRYTWIYIICPFIGSFLAWVVFFYLYRTNIDYNLERELDNIMKEESKPDPINITEDETLLK